VHELISKLSEQILPLAIVPFLLYLGAAVVLAINLKNGPNPENSNRRTALILAAIALVLHALLTYARTGMPDSLSLPFFTALSVSFVAIVFIQLLICITKPADYLGLAIYPLAGIALLASEFTNAPARSLPAAIQVHVLLSIMAYAMLALAAAQAVLVAVQRRHLRAHKPGGFMRGLPPLTSTESLLFLLLTIGFVLLSLSLASGFIFLEDMFAQKVAHKTVLSCIAWLIFGALLYGRWRFGWRGQRAVRWTLAGFCMLLIAFFGSKLVLELILQQ